MRGCMPRRRIPTSTESQSRRFVPGLPLNAYKTRWLEEQMDIANIVHPTPAIVFRHDKYLCHYVLALDRVYLYSRLTYPKESHGYAELASKGLEDQLHLTVSPSCRFWSETTSSASTREWVLRFHAQ